MRQIHDNEVNEGVPLAPEGWHHVEVRNCTEKRSLRGDSYYNLELVDAQTKDHVAYDVAMLEGRGNGMGIRKLGMLGAAERNVTADGWVIPPPERVVGQRAYVHVFHDEFEWDGEKRTSCKVSIREGEVGYRADDDPPEGPLAGRAAPGDDDNPF